MKLFFRVEMIAPKILDISWASRSAVSISFFLLGIERGRRLVEILKQKQYHPLPFEKQVCLIYAAINGFLDKIDVAQVGEYEIKLYERLDTLHQNLLEQLRQEKQIIPEIEEKLQAMLKDV